MREHGIAGIDLLVANLYPFEQTVARPDCDLATAIENIDIGGPAMLRAAAKNHAWVTVVVDSGDYGAVLEELRTGGAVTPATRFRLAAKAFEHTARYDGAIASYLGARDGTDSPAAAFPRTLNLQYAKSLEMRYGENPHQSAAFYVEHAGGQASVATARQLQGKALSFNNVADTDAALECVKGFEEPACVIVKHANPCGVAVGDRIRDAYDRAFRTDPTSAFGGIIAFNRPLDAQTAAAIVERQFVEVIVAPRIEGAALAPLSRKENVRVLECGEFPATPRPGFDFKRVTDGLLVQDRDIGAVTADHLEVVTRRSPTEAELRDLLFAWKVVKFVKSNAIVYCRDGMTIGIGAGQMSRVYSAKIAGIKALDEGPRGSRLGARLRCILPVPRRHRRRGRGRNHRGHRAGRLDARRRGHRGGRRARHGDGVHPHAALPALTVSVFTGVARNDQSVDTVGPANLPFMPDRLDLHARHYAKKTNRRVQIM